MNDIPKPNATQIAAARAVLRQFFREGGATATDSATDIALFSMLSCMTGVGRPAAQYAASVAEVTDGEIPIPAPSIQIIDGGYEVVAENVLGIPVGTVFGYPEEDEAETPMSLNDLLDMKKEKLVEAVRRETGLDITAAYGSKKQIVDGLDQWRSTKVFPEQPPSGTDTVSFGSGGETLTGD